MNCFNHPGTEAVGTCTVCGKAICQACSVDVAGRLTCKNCLSSGKVAPRLQSQPGSPTNSLAIISLVFGILGFCGGIFFSIPAWILGHLALKQIQENPNQEGSQLAKVGRTLGMVITIIFTLLILCYVLILLFALISSSTYSYGFISSLI